MKNKRNKTRREFVKKTALASSAILSAPLSLDAMVKVNRERKLKLALVGCG